MKYSQRSHKVQPVFVGGTGRSGTTVMGDLLDSHPSIIKSNPTELKLISNPQGILDLVFGSRTYPPREIKKVSPIHYRTYREKRKRERERYLQAFEKLDARFWREWWEIDAPEPHGPGLIAGYSKEEIGTLFHALKRGNSRPLKSGRAFIDALIAERVKGTSSSIWVETTPLNISNAHRILALYPHARFINMVRDPRDVIASLLTKDWGPNTPTEGVEWIAKRLREDHFALQTIPQGQLLTVKLEELVLTERDRTLKRVLDFLGVEEEPALRTFFEGKVLASSASIGRWSTVLSDEEFLSQFDAMRAELVADGISVDTFDGKMD